MTQHGQNPQRSWKTAMPLPGRDRCTGSSMVEVLVSLLILSFGSLGVAGLQGASKQATHEARHRLIASFLAQDIVERMRNNPTALGTYAGANVGGGTISAEPSPNCSAAAPCTAAQLAAHDRWLWERAIDGATVRNGNTNLGGLTAPTGCIVRNGGQVQVVIAWNDTEKLSDNADATAATTCGSASAYRRQVMIETFIG